MFGVIRRWYERRVALATAQEAVRISGLFLGADESDALETFYLIEDVPRHVEMFTRVDMARLAVEVECAAPRLIENLERYLCQQASRAEANGAVDRAIAYTVWLVTLRALMAPGQQVLWLAASDMWLTIASVTKDRDAISMIPGPMKADIARRALERAPKRPSPEAA